MTCTECLSLVATAGVSELTTAAAVTEHCRECPDCTAVVDEVAEEARRFADTLDGTPPGVHPLVIAMRAVAASSRARRRGARGRGALYGGGVIVAAPRVAWLVDGACCAGDDQIGVLNR